MTVWTQLEPLLAKVQKPARYIGCEDGVYTPDHQPGAASWLLGYPDTYEIGLPNQGLQILAETELDIAFAIDKQFGIKLPLEQWTQEVNEGKASTEQYFVLNNLCSRIDELVAAKGK